MDNSIVVIRGGGDIASGTAYTLFRYGFRVLILEIESPLMVRRAVSFAQAVYDSEALVEDVKSKIVYTVHDIYKAWDDGIIPVFIDPECKILNIIKSDILVDAIIAKKNTGTYRSLAPLTIALGPGFNAGKDVDAVIETNRGINLGKIILNGCAEDNTGIPGKVLGFSSERVLRAPCSGKVKKVIDIGTTVEKGQAVCLVGNIVVNSHIDGVLRGLIAEGIEVQEGIKLGDVDPRGETEYCFKISDKAKIIGRSVLEAIMLFKG